jgi:DNA-binding transcriptional MerR regulator
MSVSRIPDRIFFRMGDVSKILGLKPYVIRFWETEFSFIAPVKGNSGQRVYQRPQIEALFLVKHLLYVERYSIEGAKKRITELRKSGKLKAAIEQVMAGNSGDSPPEDATDGQGAPVEHPAPELPGAGLAVGDVVDKSRIQALREQVRDLQEMIREPKAAGMDVPGLKRIHH